MRTAFKPNSESLIQLDINSIELLNQLSNLLNKHSINTTNITNNTNIANTTDVANNTDIANNTNVANNTDVANTTNINNNNNNDEDIKEYHILDLLIKEVEKDELTNKFRPIYLFIYLLTK